MAFEIVGRYLEGTAGREPHPTPTPTDTEKAQLSFTAFPERCMIIALVRAGGFP